MGRDRQGLPQSDCQGSQLRLLISVIALCCSILAMADQGAIFLQGKDLGNSKNEATFSGIGSGAVSDKVPAYGSTPTEAQLFQGGQGQLSGHGSGKIQSCATYTPGIDKRSNQECEAVNFLARNPEIRPQFNITSDDQMIINAKNLRNNAESIYQSIGINGGEGTSTQCATKTETTPAQYTTETCTSLQEVEIKQCTLGREVNIDADANFQCERTITSLTSTQRTPSGGVQQCVMERVVNLDGDANFSCDKTVNAYSTKFCNRIATVTVSESSVPGPLNCTKGQQIGYKYPVAFTGSNGKDYLYIYCEASGKVKVNYRLYSMKGALLDNDTAILNAPSGGYSLIGNWYYGGGNDYLSISCNGNSCTSTFKYCYSGGGLGCYTAAGPSFTKPASTSETTYTANVSWDNQCADLEQRAQ